MTTTQRTDWKDAYGDPAVIPGTVEAIIADGPMEGTTYVECRGFQPPTRVEFPAGHGHDAFVYLLDPTQPPITYRWKP